MSSVTWRDSTQPFFLIPAFSNFTTVTSATPTSFQWNSSDGSFWTIAGSGFTYDGDGLPSGGTITSIDGTNGNGQPGLLVTGATMSASQLAGWVVTNDTVSFLKSSLGGGDTIIGNALGDSLSGNGGNDTLQGGNGNDTLAGGSGSDALEGSAGSDTADYRDFGVDNAGAGTQGVTVELTFGTATDNWGNGDTLTSIENVDGSNLSDTLKGDNNANSLSGFGGNDTLNGFGGNDWLRGGSGDDIIDGGQGIDTVDYGYDGFDSGGAPTQGVVVSLPFAEATDNWGDRDILIGIENVNGSALDDTIGGDGVANILFGLAGNDTITGGGGDDILDGGEGSDSLSASIGNDTLRGGIGNDTLTGGTGGDVFVIGEGGGDDTVTDFENGIDKINVGTLAASFAGVTVTQDGSDVVVGFGAGSPTLRLQNRSAASIDASDFMFGVAAQITGDNTGSVTEKSGVANGTAGVATVTGNLDVTDADGSETFVIQDAVVKTYGTFSIDATGAWSYTLDDGNSDVQALKAGGKLHELVTVSAADGTTQVIDITINGANDAAAFSGTLTGSVTENGGVANGTAGTATATGTVAVTDVDSAATLLVQNGAAKTYGTFSIDAAGSWTYTLDDNNAAVQALGAGQTLHELVTIMTVDGSTQQIDITINGANDAPVVTGTLTGAVSEKSGVANGLAGVATATGTLSASDVDGAATFVVQNAAVKTYGTFSIDAAGAWSYVLDDNNTDVQALNVGGTLQEVVTVVTADGTARQIAVTINGANDAAVIIGAATGSVTEKGGMANATAGVATASGTLSATDVDSAATFVVQSAAAKTYGTFSIDAAGSWTYTLDDNNAAVEALNAGGTLHELVTVSTADGTTRQMDITINGADDIVETAGATDLIRMADQYLLRDSGGNGPSLKFLDGSAVVAGQFGAWKPIGAEQVADGYQVAWQFGSDDLYQVWDTDNGGAFTGTAVAGSGADMSIQMLELTFQQDLNGDTQVGPVTTVIETAGATDLVQVGNQFFLRDSGAGPSLKFLDGGAVVAGQFGAWKPIGAEQVADGYQVAWQFGSDDLYQVWNTDSSGTFTGTAASGSGAGMSIQQSELTFQQDLNGDTQVGLVTTVIETAGTTDLVQVGNQFFLQDSGGAGPSLKFLDGDAVVTGQFGAWKPIGAEQVADGYQVAWQFGSDDLYQVWNTDSSGTFTGTAASGSGAGMSIQQSELTFQQDLNGDTQVGLVTTVIETAGTTDLVQVGNQFFLQDSGGAGPSLKFLDGDAVVTGQFGAWKPIGAEQVADGYQVAWQFGSDDLYQVWNTDSSGTFTGTAASGSGADLSIQQLELTFQQDLNGDTQVGLVTTVIETAGTTDLVQVGNQFFLRDSGAGPSLKFLDGGAVVAGQFGAWKPIGAEQVADGYQVAWQFGSDDLYQVWNTDSSGTFTGTAASGSGTGMSIQQSELTFQQDLNGDTQVGLVTTVIETAGTTDLVQVGNQFFLQDSGGAGPSLKFLDGDAVVTGQFGAWKPIGAEQVADGYQVAWQFGSDDLYQVWNTDSSGTFTGTAASGSGAGMSIQQSELTFQQDLNGDTQVGLVTTVIETAGTTDLVQVGNQFFLNDSGGAGPSLKYGGDAFTAGGFGAWAPIAVEQVTDGYQVAWQLGSDDLYQVWNTDSSGDFTSSPGGAMHGADAALQAFESFFQQDLNRDHAIV